MKLPIQRFLGVLAGLTMVLGSTLPVSAASGAQSTGTIYVSSTGSGTSCTQAAPCSMTTGAKNLAAGKTLFLMPGTYSAALQITKSGTAAQPIKVNGPAIVQSVTVSGSYVELANLEIAGATGHGIAISGKHIKFSNFSVHDNVNENKSGAACTGTGSWGSGVKVGVGGEDVQISNGKVFHNCGEGLAVTRGINVSVSNVVSYDNFSANFYLDNSRQVTLQKSFAYCTSDTNYYRSGQPASGVLIGEEYYSGWGGQLADLTIVNNIMYGCKGLYFYGVESSVPNGGLAGALIAHNTIWKVYAGGKAISISSQPANQGIIIGNNIAGGVISPDNATVVKNQSTAVFAGTPGYTLASFVTAPNSPGVNAGAALGIVTDIGNYSRDALPDVGAWETAGNPSTLTPVSSTATKAASPTVTRTAVKTATATVTKTRTPAPTLQSFTPTMSGATATSVHRGVTVLDQRIASGNDDAEEGSSGYVSLDSSDLELIYDSSQQVIGLRFAGVKLPQGATILNAYVQFRVDETSSSSVTLSVRGEASPNAAAFSTVSRNLSTRMLTSASVSWTPPAWPTLGASGLDQRTPELAPLVQEIVNQADWAAGNALVLIITGSSNKRVAEAFEGNVGGAPLLHVEYATDGLMPEPLTSPTASPTPIGSPTLPATPFPTGTPVPTETPAPTETPEPTGTPMPTYTPAPTETPTEVIVPTEPVSPTPVSP
jgi:hypothetical protein